MQRAMRHERLAIFLCVPAHPVLRHNQSLEGLQRVCNRSGTTTWLAGLKAVFEIVYVRTEMLDISDLSFIFQMLCEQFLFRERRLP